jgi:AcrR family transcriptional regulator
MAMPRTATKPAPDRRNQIGQRIGAKGQRTRQKLIDVTVGLLESHGMRDLTVAEVARVAATSPATFYVYFDSVQAVVLGALEQAPHTTDELQAMVAAPWTDGLVSALNFVTRYTDSWNRHGTVFRVRNMAAEEGDERFLNARQAVALPMLRVFAAKIADGQRAGTISAALHPESTAGVILAMLERVSSVGPTRATATAYGITYQHMREAAAYMLVQLLGEGTVAADQPT